MRFFKPNVDALLRKRDAGGLLKALNDNDRGIRDAAADALVKISQSSSTFAVPIASRLVASELQSADRDIRDAAVNVLVEIGEPVIGPLITTLTLQFKDKSIYETVADVLVKIGQREVEQLIFEMERHFWLGSLDGFGILDEAISIFERVLEGIDDIKDVQEVKRYISQLKDRAGMSP